MTHTKSKSYWLIQGYDSTTKIYERKVDAAHMTQVQMKELLKALTAKAGLTYDEMVGAYATKRTKIANNHLEIQKDGPLPKFTCGSNPFFVASILK